MTNLTAKQLVAAVARHSGCTKAAVKATLDSLAEVTLHSLQDAETVIIPGLCRIRAKVRGPRRQRHPQTGDIVTVPAKQVVQFSPATPLATALATLPAQP